MVFVFWTKKWFKLQLSDNSSFGFLLLHWRPKPSSHRRWFSLVFPIFVLITFSPKRTAECRKPRNLLFIFYLWWMNFSVLWLSFSEIFRIIHLVRPKCEVNLLNQKWCWNTFQPLKSPKSIKKEYNSFENASKLSLIEPIKWWNGTKVYNFFTLSSFKSYYECQHCSNIFRRTK